MDRKMFDINDFRNRVNNDNFENTKPQICFDTNFCKPQETQSSEGILTMAFVNPQPLDYVYEEGMAFNNGTLFPNINKPFYYGGNNK